PSPSLQSLFPTVEAAMITAIIQHDLHANKLFKLNFWYRNKSDHQVLMFNGTALEVSSRDTVAKEYKSYNSVAVPLTTYFSVLIAYINIADVRDVARHFQHYGGHLLKLSVDYEWSAVLAYHSDFFNRRRREMSEGVYTGWGRQDPDLAGEHLFNHHK
ncbi:hypothetical protein FIBSPDRAFT_665012, partial [Athelia psychrophila]